MCGVTAIFGGRERPASVADIHRMTSAIRHRGPDGAGFAILDQGRLIFGHARLSIIDLEGGEQPLFNEDGTIALTFNGEIYDHAALRAELIAEGHRFRTRSDAEVVIHLYEARGLRFLERLNGEFAFVLWDGKRRRLLAVKDRFGVKPLFYGTVGDELLIASEAKALLALPRFPRAIAPEYMAGPFLGGTRSSSTPFAGIQAVRPGHYLLAEAGYAPVEVAYWTPRFAPDPGVTFDEACDGVRRHLRAAVRRRMVADVRVGAYLSGGLDSTLVAGLMAEAGAGLKAFNVGFGDAVYDESELAARIARHYGITFESVRCTPDVLAAGFLKTIRHVEGPINNPNSIAKQILSAHARSQGYKVCLTGEGSDELFGGYAFFKLEGLWRMMRDPRTAPAARTLWRRFQAAEHRSEGFLWRRRMPWARAEHAFGYPSFFRLSIESSARLMRLVLSRGVLARRGDMTPIVSADREHDPRLLRALHPFNATRLVALNLMTNYIIPALGDRVEMANALECRTPFLDVELAEYSARLPPGYFLDLPSLSEKHILKRAFADLLPPFTRAETKHPFMAPTWGSFAATAEGRELFETFLSRRALTTAGLLDPTFTRTCYWLWRTLPRGARVRRYLDGFMGVALSMQALHQELIVRPIAGDDGFSMRDRSGPAPLA